MKKILCLIFVAVFVNYVLFASGQGEKKYPQRNIEVIVQYSAGGPTDLSVRGVLDSASTDLPKGVSFITSNVTGGSGLIGFNKFLTSKADGYTIGVANTDLAINYVLARTKISISDYIPLACTLFDPFALVIAPNAKYSNLAEFIDYAKAHSGEVIVGHTGIGAAPHLAGLAVEKFFGIKFKYVAFNGSADCVTALLGGHIAATFTQPAPALSQLKAGNLKMLCVLADERTTTWPNIPSLKELYPKVDFQIIGYAFIVAHKDLDPEIVKYLSGILDKAAVSEKYKGVLANLNMQQISISAAKAPDFLKAQYVFYKDLCANIQP